ncbi:MAG: hypothetical protein PF440_03080 [Thiomicrorhabdus sp.]|jgi:hypothetical protein|nr:hypothetical protein [Thiomicrorhabdus sp.]
MSNNKMDDIETSRDMTKEKKGFIRFCLFNDVEYTPANRLIFDSMCDDVDRDSMIELMKL